ncbi:MAG: aminotransferase class III-fold pyridoxal phosphate-dependent enzyme, partial [Halanaerobium sp. MSAO_Bac5]
MNYLNLYNHYDFEIDFADGVYIYDKKGKKYIDTFSGIGVLALGHSHPEVINSL